MCYRSPRSGDQGSLKLALPEPLEVCLTNFSFSKLEHSDHCTERGKFWSLCSPFPEHWEACQSGGGSSSGLRALRGHTYRDQDKFPSHIQFPHCIQIYLLAIVILASFILYLPVPIWKEIERE